MADVDVSRNRASSGVLAQSPSRTSLSQVELIEVSTSASLGAQIQTLQLVELGTPSTSRTLVLVSVLADYQSIYQFLADGATPEPQIQTVPRHSERALVRIPEYTSGEYSGHEISASEANRKAETFGSTSKRGNKSYESGSEDARKKAEGAPGRMC